jgi:hypothetical protein
MPAAGKKKNACCDRAKYNLSPDGVSLLFAKNLNRTKVPADVALFAVT